MSPEEWAFKIKELILEAEADGFGVFIDSDSDLAIQLDLPDGNGWLTWDIDHPPVKIEWF